MELEHASGVCRLTMTGEGKFNDDSLAAFNTALDAALAETSADLLLITGQEKSFSQGLDLEYLMKVGEENPAQAMDFTRRCLEMVARLLSFPMPVASVINGHAFGLGAMIALASDYKVMRADRGYFCLPEVDLGMTLTTRMNALVCGKLSGNTLRDVLLTGQRVSGLEAVGMEIVDAAGSLDELTEIALELAAPMRGKQREALAGLKRGMNSEILAVLESDSPEHTIQA